MPNLGGPSPGTAFAEAHALTATGKTVISLPVGGSVVDVTAAMFRESGRVYPESPVKTDADGRLQLRLWLGERYRITIGPRFSPDLEMEFVATNKPLSITLRAR